MAYQPRPYEMIAAAADKTIMPQEGETLEYLWPGYNGQGQWRKCTIIRWIEGHQWNLHGRLYIGIDHNDKIPKEQLIKPLAFRKTTV